MNGGGADGKTGSVPGGWVIWPGAVPLLWHFGYRLRLDKGCRDVWMVQSNGGPGLCRMYEAPLAVQR